MLAINQRTARYVTCSFAVKYSIVPTTQGIISLPSFATHDLINEHNSGYSHHLLGQSTLKNSSSYLFTSSVISINHFIQITTKHT